MAAAHGNVYIIGDAKELLAVDDKGYPKFGQCKNTKFDFRLEYYNIFEFEGATIVNVPRAGPNNLNMERCDFCTHDDAVEMMGDFQEWKAERKLKFEPEA